MTDRERAIFWENTAKENEIESQYYQEELVKAHALLGRVIHQLSEHWDSVNLTMFFPTNNPHHRKTSGNSTGEKK